MFFENMIQKMKDLNEELLIREENKPKKDKLRPILEKFGSFNRVERFSNDEIQQFTQGKGVVGVDGSYTTVGNTFPHILFFAQALAKCTNANDDGVRLSNVFNISTESEQSLQGEQLMISEYSKRVTAMEVNAAYETLDKYNPALVMFDGGFWRLSKDASSEWKKYKQKSLNKNILSVGIIEDAGSFELFDKMKEHIELSYFMTDSDLLFNNLEIGEVYFMHSPFENIYKVFARFSNDPLPIVCDFMTEHKSDIIPILRFVYSLTPLDGRGIPIWIDMVDKEVKITKEETDLFIDSYLNPVLKEKLFTGKRNRR